MPGYQLKSLHDAVSLHLRAGREFDELLCELGVRRLGGDGVIHRLAGMPGPISFSLTVGGSLPSACQV